MNVTVIGQGYVGLPILIKAAEAGFSVTGFDINSQKIENLKLGITSSPDVTKMQILTLLNNNKINFTSNLKDVKKSEIFVISVPTPLLPNRDPDLTMLISACKMIGEVVSPNSLVINESTSYIGTLRNLIKPTIDKVSNYKSIKYAVAPERIDPGNPKWSVQNTPRIVGGLDSESTDAVSNFYSKFCENVTVVSKPEVAEAAKLFENTFRQVNIALVNNLSKLSHMYDFTGHEVIAAASTKPFGFMAFYPGVGVGGHCIPIDPKYLDYSAENVDFALEFVKISDRINVSNPNYIVTRIKSNLFTDLNGKQIQIAGIAYKTNISDIRESPALELLNLLKAEGANVTWHDPLVGHLGNEKSSPLNSNIDLGLIVTPHEVIDFSPWLNFGTKVLDLSSNKANFGWPKFL
jgi:UDP-N-acetyl-D-glucosamine dehydrogenase